MKIDLIIDGEVYLAEPYLGQEGCLDCELKEVCDNLASYPCSLYPPKVIFRRSLSENNPKAFVKEYTPEQASFLSTSILESDLTTRAINALYMAGIKTFYDILNETPSNILRIRHIGKSTIYKLLRAFELQDIVWAKNDCY